MAWDLTGATDALPNDERDTDTGRSPRTTHPRSASTLGSAGTQDVADAVGWPYRMVHHMRIQREVDGRGESQTVGNAKRWALSADTTK